MIRSVMVAVAMLSIYSMARAEGAPTVHVTIGSALLSKADDIGRRDLEDLKHDLRDTVTRAIKRSGGGGGQLREIDLVIEDAKPNRPTFEQMGRNASLSMSSISIGGARISGQVIDADGVSHALDLRYYETDIRDSRGAVTWTDADRAFDLVATRIATGRYHRE